MSTNINSIFNTDDLSIIEQIVKDRLDNDKYRLTDAKRTISYYSQCLLDDLNETNSEDKYSNEDIESIKNIIKESEYEVSLIGKSISNCNRILDVIVNNK